MKSKSCSILGTGFRFSLIGCLLLMGAWMLFIGSTWFLVRYKHGNLEAKFADMLLPHRWENFTASRGNHYIAQAEKLIQERDAAGALHLLRAGLAKSPANIRGRLLLAELYQQARRPDLTKETYLGGLPALAHDHDYHAALFRYLAEQEDDVTIVRLATSLLAHQPEPALAALLSVHAATAAYQRGNYDQAEVFLSRGELTSASSEALLLQVRIDWARGLPDLAVSRLQGFLTQKPADQAALALLTEYYRRLGRTAEWQTTVVAQLAADPLSAAPRIEYLRLLHYQGDSSRMRRQAEEFLAHFAHDSRAMLQLAGFAAEAGQPALAQRVRASLSPDNALAQSIILLIAEAQLAAGEHAESSATLAQLGPKTPASDPRIASAAHSLQAIALYAQGRAGEARFHLEEFLSRSDLRADGLVLIARRLVAVGAREPARTILTRAIEHAPLNQPARALLLEFALESDDMASLVAHLEPYLKLRQPSRELLLRIRDQVGSDRHLFFAPQAPTLAALRTALPTAH